MDLLIKLGLNVWCENTIRVTEEAYFKISLNLRKLLLKQRRMTVFCLTIFNAILIISPKFGNMNSSEIRVSLSTDFCCVALLHDMVMAYKIFQPRSILFLDIFGWNSIGNLVSLISFLHLEHSNTFLNCGTDSEISLNEN